MGEARLVEAWRGDVVESVHHGVAAVADGAGEIVAGWGDVDRVTFPRSSLKPVQAVALVESGSADAMRLTERHLAIACASHHGEPAHVALVGAWLGALGLDETALACGPALPTGEASRDALLRGGGGPSRLHHNCSGKHTGFLCQCRHEGWPVDGYDDPAHPAQRRYRDVLGDFLGRDADGLAWGVDNCVLPAAALPVADAARLAARYAGGRGVAPGRRAATERLLGAMRAHPDLVSGSTHATVGLVRATGGRVVVKSGAEGFLLAFVAEAGLGIAVKCGDGNARATFPAMIAILDRLGLLGADERRALAGLREPAILDSAGRVCGRLVPCLDAS